MTNRKFIPNVERWREAVNLEIERYRDKTSLKKELEQIEDELPDIILAIIHMESRGIPGIESKKSTKHGAYIRTDSGESTYCMHALGLMQITPTNMRERKVTYDEMTGADPVAVSVQIRTGLYVFLFGYFQLHKKFGKRIPIWDITCWSIAAYNQGIGAVTRIINAMVEFQITPLWLTLVDDSARWKIEAKTINYVTEVLNLLGQIDKQPDIQMSARDFCELAYKNYQEQYSLEKITEYIQKNIATGMRALRYETIVMTLQELAELEENSQFTANEKNIIARCAEAIAKIEVPE